MMRPGTKAPKLKVETLNHGVWTLSEKKPENFSLVVFYRGKHCPVCKECLETLAKLTDKFKETGVTEILAVSGDTHNVAEETAKEWETNGLTLEYGLSLQSMKDWGLFISSAINDDEPELFNEPGLFLVDTEGKLFYCSTNSMPFARPPVREILEAAEFVKKKGYPRRGSISYDEIDEKSKDQNKASKDSNKESKNEDEESGRVNWESEREMADNHIINKPSEEKQVPDLKN